jgi:NAD+ kinase
MALVGFVYNALIPDAPGLISSLIASMDLSARSWVCSAEDVSSRSDELEDTTLIVVAGGDGTILRAIQVIAAHQVPIVAVNMGRVGFMSELRVEEAAERLPMYVNGEMRVERRMMLQATVTSHREQGDTFTSHALNDVVVGRGGVAKLLDIETRVDGVPLTSYRADAVIVSTATGSTGYALSAGSPILYPEAKMLVVQPVAAHTGLRDGLVLPEDSVIELSASDGKPASFSVDGLEDRPLGSDSSVAVARSPYEALFLRAKPPEAFYSELTRRLGLVYNLTPPGA